MPTVEVRSSSNGLWVKSILSVIATVLMFRETPISDIGTLLAIPMAFAVVYDLCSLYQMSLRLTRNYVVAVIVFLLIFGGILYLYDHYFSFWERIEASSLIGEIFVVFVTLLVLLLPFLWDVRRLVGSTLRKAPPSAPQ